MAQELKEGENKALKEMVKKFAEDDANKAHKKQVNTIFMCVFIFVFLYIIIVVFISVYIFILVYAFIFIFVFIFVLIFIM